MTVLFLLSFDTAKVQKFRVSTKFFPKKTLKKTLLEKSPVIVANIPSL